MFVGGQLQPETILHVATETESRLWSQGGIADARDETLDQEPTDVGMCILQHGTSTREILDYFMGLEQRKCCLLLAACKQTFFNVRLVRNDGRDSGIEEGAMMKSSLGFVDTVMCLNAEEFQVFQQALKCAAFPVLGAPEPPSEATPPIHSETQNLYSIINRKEKEATGILQYNRSMTPLSLHDSGVEEQEDTAMVPMETLCELLRRAFRLTQEKFNQYEEIIASRLKKKSPQKILAEELVRQLIALENNVNPYYSHTTFVNRIGYDQWQQRERTNITDLLGKFWHFSLPNISDRSVKMPMMHQQYRQLLELLIRYESPYRQQNELIAPPPTSPLSSASVRLLKEFGLRYGVGEQYRKIVYLSYLSFNFDPTIWFTHHVMSSLTSVMESMPTKRSYLIIIKEEYTILENSLYLLEIKSSAAIAKMKTLFSSKRPMDGVEPLIELLSLTLQAKTYLLMSPEEQLGNRLYKIVQTIFPTAYERHKMVAEDELRHNKWDTELSPKLLNMLIGQIREEVQDYKQNYQPAFQRYFNITVEAAQEFYKRLMSDVSVLLNETKENKNDLEVNKLMLSLAYRLNQLDQDWTMYISPQMQTWRDIFLIEAQHWGAMMKLDMQRFITDAVSLDKYTMCELQWTGSLLSSSHRSVRQRTISSKSLTPSVNSAFTSPPSAASASNVVPRIAPLLYHAADAQHSQTSKPRNVPAFPVEALSSAHFDSASLYPERRATSDPVSISQSSLLNGSYLGDMARSLGHYDDENLLSFAHLRHSSSLPNILARQKFMEMVPASFNGSLQEDQQKPGNHPSLNRNLSVSPEISNVMSAQMYKNHKDESADDNSGTLTDDSCSQEGEFSFPPLQEVNSSAKMHSSDNVPITVISNVAARTADFSPNAQDTSAFVGPVRPVAHFASASTGDIRPVAHNISDTAEKQKSIKTKGKGARFESKLNRNQNICVDKSAVRVKDTVPNDSTTKSAIKTHASILKHSEARHIGSTFRHEDSLTDSLASSISLPRPPQSPESVNTSLPVSSSAVDVIVILQRLVGIGSVFCRTLAPCWPGYDSDQSLLTSGRDDDLPCPPIYTKSRQKLYDCFLNAIRGIINVYADNMLCMDLCGISQSMSSRLAGSRLVQYLRTQQESGLIWGCRHDLSKKNCFEYLNKHSSLLCDRHEPIRRAMCTRINNVSMMLSCLDWYHHCLGNAFGIYGDLSVKQKRKYLQSSFNSTELIRSEFIVVDGYEYDPAFDRSEVMETASQLSPSLKSNPDCQLLVTSPVDTDRDHLMAILRALCRVMAYRLNLFVCDALPVLLNLKGSNVPIDVGLKPITDFLSSYIVTLHGWMFKEPYRRVLECLWIFIVQDFEIELSKIERSDYDTENQGQLLLQALAHLLKFMNNQHESLRRELLLSQADDVSFKLSLYAMPLTQLIAMYRGLTRDMGTSSDVSSTDSGYQSILVVRQRLKHDLQTLKKGFSGTELICWILKNQQLFYNFDPALSESIQMFSRETANVIAQRFLDWDLIADVEGDTVTEGDGDNYQFPPMTIHIDAPDPKERPVSRGSDNSTPQATSRATPKPGLRASVRAHSRHSGLKPNTPAFRLSDRSQLPNLTRSQRPNETEISSMRTDQPTSIVETESSSVRTDQPTSIVETESSSVRIDRPTSIMETNIDSGFSDTKLRRSRYSECRQESDDDRGLADSMEPVSFEFTKRWNQGQGHEKMTIDYDPYLRETPLSISSAISFDSRNGVFFESSDNFYYVCPYIGDEQNPTWTNYELFHLVEECFQKKISAKYILRIIYSRRKYDGKAREFLKSSSVDLIERIKFEASREEVPMCVSS